MDYDDEDEGSYRSDDEHGDDSDVDIGDDVDIDNYASTWKDMERIGFGKGIVPKGLQGVQKAIEDKRSAVEAAIANNVDNYGHLSSATKRYIIEMLLKDKRIESRNIPAYVDAAVFVQRLRRDHDVPAEFQDYIKHRSVKISVADVYRYVRYLTRK